MAAWPSRGPRASVPGLLPERRSGAGNEGAAKSRRRVAHLPDDEQDGACRDIQRIQRHVGGHRGGNSGRRAEALENNLRTRVNPPAALKACNPALEGVWYDWVLEDGRWRPSHRSPDFTRPAVHRADPRAGAGTGWA